jgi:oligoribonuclease
VPITLKDQEEGKMSVDTAASSKDKSDNLIWLDLEMTGLDTTTDHIIEIATIVTDKNLVEVAEGPVLAVSQSEDVMNAMDEWNTRQHGKSGLIERVLNEGVSLADAEARTVEFLEQYTVAGKSPMCGNSICQDRRFMAREMSTLEVWFHYRNLDVSSFKIVAQLWAPQVANSVEKESAHRALADIRDSIAELRHYRQHLLNASALQQT